MFKLMNSTITDSLYAPSMIFFSYCDRKSPCPHGTHILVQKGDEESSEEGGISFCVIIRGSFSGILNRDLTELRRQAMQIPEEELSRHGE